MSMQVGIIGASSPSMAGLLSTILVNSSNGSREFRFVYRNREDNEFYSKVYSKDNTTTRSDFLETLKSQEMLYNEQDAIAFLKFKDSEQIFKEVL